MITNANFLAKLSHKHIFDALPFDNGGLPARITDYLNRYSVRPASQSDELDVSDQRVAFHAIPYARLSPSPARYFRYQHVFVPRDDVTYAMCQVYMQMVKYVNWHSLPLSDTIYTEHRWLNYGLYRPIFYVAS
jgi:hypothetical protein